MAQLAVRSEGNKASDVAQLDAPGPGKAGPKPGARAKGQGQGKEQRQGLTFPSGNLLESTEYLLQWGMQQARAVCVGPGRYKRGLAGKNVFVQNVCRLCESATVRVRKREPSLLAVKAGELRLTRSVCITALLPQLSPPSLHVCKHRSATHLRRRQPSSATRPLWT